MSAEDLATVREYLARGSGIDGRPNDPVAELVRRILAELDAVTAEREALQKQIVADAWAGVELGLLRGIADALAQCEESDTIGEVKVNSATKRNPNGMVYLSTAVGVAIAARTGDPRKPARACTCAQPTEAYGALAGPCPGCVERAQAAT